MMCQRLALELGDRVAVIAPVAGTMPAALGTVTPPYAVSVLLIHGTRDRFAPYEGGRAHGPGRLVLLLGGVRRRASPGLSVRETADRWREIDRCNDAISGKSIAATESDPPGVDVGGWTGGQGGTAVERWTVAGGHTWPGGPANFAIGILGRTTGHFDAGDVIWQFMAEHFRAAASRRLQPDDSRQFWWNRAAQDADGKVMKRYEGPGR